MESITGICMTVFEWGTSRRESNIISVGGVYIFLFSIFVRVKIEM